MVRELPRVFLDPLRGIFCLLYLPVSNHKKPVPMLRNDTQNECWTDFEKMGQSRPLFCLFSSFQHDTNQYKLIKA